MEGRGGEKKKRTGQASLADFSSPPIEIIAFLTNPVTGLLDILKNRV